MNALTHKVGLEIDLTSPEAQHPDYKKTIEAKILKKEGIFYAGFSQEHPDAGYFFWR